MTTAEIQAALDSAPANSTVAFAAGTYSITAGLVPPCGNLTLAGPIANPPTAILSATFGSGALFNVSNCNGLSIEYFAISGAGLAYVGATNNSEIAILCNQVTQSGENDDVFLDGYLADSLNDGGVSIDNLDTDINISNNSFGDSSTCSEEYTGNDIGDNDGVCNGIYTGVGELEGLTVSSNNFYHMSEPIHVNQWRTGWNPGDTVAFCDNCKLDYNFMLNYHRTSMEIQVSSIASTLLVEHNLSMDPLVPYWETFAYSMACCVSSYTQGSAPSASIPQLLFNDNVAIASTPCGGDSQANASCAPMAVEFWGSGATLSNSLLEGNFSNGVQWGYSSYPWYITNNYVCMGEYGLDFGQYITDEGYNNMPPPTLSGNTTALTCAAQPSIAPTISSSGETVTLSDTGSNTGIWYTTDGSDPVPGAGTALRYAGPFQVSGNVNVKAVGMWGAPNQPTTYPVGYGYTPSPIVSATVSG